MRTDKATIRDVAEAAGVSTATVSRYLTRPNLVTEKTAYRIKDAIQELNYRPNAFGRSLRQGRTNLVGIVIPHAGYFFGNTCRVAGDWLLSQGYLTYVCITDNDSAKERQYIEDLINRHAAGLIVVPSGQNTQFLLSVSEQYHNMVLFDRQEFECDTVLTMDHVNASRQLCDYMLSRHPAQPVYAVMGYEYNSTVRQITYALTAALQAVGRTPETAHLYYNCAAERSLETACSDILQSIRSNENPIVLCFGENFTESLMLRLGCREEHVQDRIYLAGYAVQTTMARLGFDYPCAIRDMTDGGLMAARALMKRLEDPEGKQPPVLYYAASEVHLP